MRPRSGCNFAHAASENDVFSEANQDPHRSEDQCFLVITSWAVLLRHIYVSARLAHLAAAKRISLCYRLAGGRAASRRLPALILCLVSVSG
jgi:hypothetical protein